MLHGVDVSLDTREPTSCPSRASCIFMLAAESNQINRIKREKIDWSFVLSLNPVFELREIKNSHRIRPLRGVWYFRVSKRVDESFIFPSRRESYYLGYKLSRKN